MKNNKILKATFIVMIVTVFSRFLGLFRDMLVAANFGTSVYTDAYKAAVTVPDAVFAMVGLGISTVFIPMLSKVKHEKSKDEMFNFSNNLISILSLISIAIFTLGLFFTEEIVRAFAVGFDAERIAIAVFLTRISLINLLFLSINACYTVMLQVCEDFVVPSILGMFFNAPIILYLIFFKDVNILGLTIANVLGNIFRVLVQLPSLYKQGYRIKFFINLKDERIKRILFLVTPVIIGAGANSLNMIVDTNIASTLSVGSMSAVDYAQKIVVFANTAITTSIVSVMYPVMANKLNAGDKEGFLSHLSKSVVIIALLLVPIAAGFIILNKEIITVFYGRGLFDVEAISITALAFLGYSFAIPFIGVRDMLNSSLFSMEKTKLTTMNGIIGVVINIVLSVTLSRIFGIIGIAIAASVASAVTAILLFISVRKTIGEFDLGNLVYKLIKILSSAMIMVIVLILVDYFVKVNNSFIKIILSGGIGSLIFFASCKVFRIDELNEFINLMKNKVFRKTQ